MSTSPSDAKPSQLGIDVLCLDPQNPRLPQDMQGSDEDALLKYIATTFNAIEVGRSIFRFGYFASEPLIVVDRGDGTYLVLEGNRRLVALRILAEPSLASELDDASEWKKLAKGAQLPDKIPVVIAADRRTVAPIIGYRHISGIEPWEPYEKARFVASLVDDEHLDFEEVANIVGERSTDVAAIYRNYAIVRDAQQLFDIDTQHVQGRFGVFTRAMNSPSIRNHIEAPSSQEVAPAKPALSQDAGAATKELFSFLFGDEESTPVIADSRDITKLGVVLAATDGLQVLRATRDLEAAFIAAGGLHSRLVTRLNNARTNLLAAKEDMPAYINEDDVQELLAQCKEALQELIEFNDQS